MKDCLVHVKKTDVADVETSDIHLLAKGVPGYAFWGNSKGFGKCICAPIKGHEKSQVPGGL